MNEMDGTAATINGYDSRRISSFIKIFSRLNCKFSAKAFAGNIRLFMP